MVSTKIKIKQVMPKKLVETNHTTNFEVSTHKCSHFFSFRTFEFTFLQADLIVESFEYLIGEQ